MCNTGTTKYFLSSTTFSVQIAFNRSINFFVVTFDGKKSSDKYLTFANAIGGTFSLRY